MAFKKKHIPWNKDKKLTRNHRENISESRKGQTSSMKGKTKANGLYPKQCGFSKEHLHYTTKGDFKTGHRVWNKGLTKDTDNRVRKYAGKIQGSKNGMYGKIAFGMWDKYKNIWMRSSWEILYAKWLDKRGIKWEYEPDTFKLSSTTYTPDFKLENKKYVEIKGWLSPKTYFKIKEFILNNPDIDYAIITERDLKKMGVLK